MNSRILRAYARGLRIWDSLSSRYLTSDTTEEDTEYPEKLYRTCTRSIECDDFFLEEDFNQETGVYTVGARRESDKEICHMYFYPSVKGTRVS